MAKARFAYLVEHDLFRKPVPTFRAHALSRLLTRGGSQLHGHCIFFPPKGWEDWATLILGLWLWVSPVLIGFDDPAATAHFYLISFLVIACELFAFYLFRTWEEWINIVLGLWLIFAAVYLFSARAAKSDAMIIGVLLVALSFYEMWEDRRSPQQGP